MKADDERVNNHFPLILTDLDIPSITFFETKYSEYD